MSRQRTASLVGRVLAGLVTVVVGAVFVLAVAALIGSRFGGPERDPHGYGLIVGTVTAAVTGLIVAAVLPLALPPRLVGRAYPITMAVFGVVFCLLIVSALTA